ncbi:MAG: DUF3795 domain-containing protein [Bacteroidetes bacterium]|nr:DUF3795 domain-containing protein [Bacteroidota bacterium]
MKYHHLGIPTDTPRPNEIYLEPFKMFVSGYDESPFHIEWIRFEAGSPLPEIVRTVPHVAFEVDHLEKALEGHEILISPNSPSKGIRVAFVLSDGAPVEFLETEGSEAQTASPEEILDALGPCGLYCSKCFAFQGGPIREYSQKLQEALGDFDKYAERFVKLLHEPIFLFYPYFKEMVSYFAKGHCKGCRMDTCQLYKACNVKSCAVARHVDFCFQCPEFPCKTTNFDEHLKKRWIDVQNRMKEEGPERYFLATKSGSRY